MTEPHDDVEALLAERRAANPRRSLGREPAGAGTARRWLVATLVVVLAASAVLFAALLVGGA